MAKNDKDGNLITSLARIRDLYLDAYITKLKNREIKPELYDLYLLKTELWLSRQEYLKDNKYDSRKGVAKLCLEREMGLS